MVRFRWKMLNEQINGTKPHLFEYSLYNIHKHTPLIHSNQYLHMVFGAVLAVMVYLNRARINHPKKSTSMSANSNPNKKPCHRDTHTHTLIQGWNTKHHHSNADMIKFVFRQSFCIVFFRCCIHPNQKGLRRIISDGSSVLSNIMWYKHQKRVHKSYFARLLISTHSKYPLGICTVGCWLLTHFTHVETLAVNGSSVYIPRMHCSCSCIFTLMLGRYTQVFMSDDNGNGADDDGGDGRVVVVVVVMVFGG